MDQGTLGVKVPVTITVGEELLREACALTSDLSGAVEDLLIAYVARERMKRAGEPAAIDKAIAATNEFVDKYGLPGADFAPV